MAKNMPSSQEDEHEAREHSCMLSNELYISTKLVYADVVQFHIYPKTIIDIYSPFTKKST